jgi:hypothetical protein
MARTVVVTKSKVEQTGPKRYIITLNMKYLEDGTNAELIDKDYSVEYLYGEAPSIYVSTWDREMQADIAKFKAEEALFNNSLLNSAVTAIQNGLEV